MASERCSVQEPLRQLEARVLGGSAGIKPSTSRLASLIVGDQRSRLRQRGATVIAMSTKANVSALPALGHDRLLDVAMRTKAAIEKAIQGHQNDENSARTLRLALGEVALDIQRAELELLTSELRAIAKGAST